MGISLLGRRLPALLIALAAVFALVTPAASVAAPADTAAAAAAVEPAVVQITTKIDYQQAIGTGTGTVIDPGGVVLTNYHVVAGANTVTGTVGGRDYPADLVGYDRTHDIAVLQLRGAGGLPTAPIGDSGQVVVGESTVGLGNARGVGAPLTHETGPVTALNRTVNAEDSLTGSSEEVNGLIEVAADVRPGDSGGPLVNSAGQVIGVVTAATVTFQMGPAERVSRYRSMTRWPSPVRSGPARRRPPCTSDSRCCSASVSEPSRAGKRESSCATSCAAVRPIRPA